MSERLELLERQRQHEPWVVKIDLMRDRSILGGIKASIHDINGERKAMVRDFLVLPKEQHRGYGIRLMGALVRVLLERQTTELWSYSLTDSALWLRRRFFGERALHFYDTDNPEFGFLPATFDQALLTEELALEHNIDPFGIAVDLTNIDKGSLGEEAIVLSDRTPVKEQFLNDIPRGLSPRNAAY